ncbi:hypothetical protein M3231_27730 [Neobacillus mesonae]|nr:hypothetical protein [Neobacillus mesonae]
MRGALGEALEVLTLRVIALLDVPLFAFGKYAGLGRAFCAARLLHQSHPLFASQIQGGSSWSICVAAAY